MSKVKGKDPAFLLYTSDFLTGTYFMTDEQVGLYIRLLCLQHQKDGRIDANAMRAQCSRIAGGDAVLSKFEQDERGYYNVRLEKEINLRSKKIEEVSEKARIAAEKRWKPTQMPTHCVSNAQAMPSEDENEDENEDGNKGKGGVGERGLAIRDPRTPESIRAYFAELGQPAEAERFIDYYQSNGWKVGRNAMKDWRATARNWVRRNNPQPDDQSRRIVRDSTVGDIERMKAGLAQLWNPQKPQPNDTDTNPGE